MTTINLWVSDDGEVLTPEQEPKHGGNICRVLHLPPGPRFRHPRHTSGVL